MATASPFIATLGSFSQFTDMFGVPLFSFAGGIIGYLVLNDFSNGTLGPAMLAYFGDVVVVVLCNLAAAYLVYKTTLAAISFVNGFFAKYGRISTLGDLFGLFEILFYVLFMGTAVAIIVEIYYVGIEFWRILDERTAGAANDGFFGVAVSYMDAFKLGTLGTILVLASWIAAYGMGEVNDNLISWIDEWSKPGTNVVIDTATDADAAESMQYDLIYHAVTVVYTWIAFMAIKVGGYNFAFSLFSFKPVENCDLAGVNESVYSDVRSLVAGQTDLKSCKAATKKIFNIADLDRSGIIGRCENAKFLYGLGNSQEYALKYSEIKTLAGLYASCVKRFPVAAESS